MKMKTNLKVLTVCTLLATSCSNEEIVNNDNLLMAGDEYTIEVELGKKSRAYYEEENGMYPIKWNETDKIEVRSDDGKVHGTLSLEEYTDETKQRAKFRGTVYGNKKNLAYAVYPVRDSKTKKIDLTTRDASMPNPPMIGTFGDDKTTVNFEETTPAIQLTINNIPEDETLVVKGTGISGTAEVVKDGDKYGLKYTSDNKNSITLTNVPEGKQTIYVPVIAPEATLKENGINEIELTVQLKNSGAEYSKVVKFKDQLVTDSPENGFLELTYHADTNELTEAWNGEASDDNIDFKKEVVEIHDAAGLKAFADYVKEGNAMKQQTVKLMNDVDLNGQAWTPIGEYGIGNTYFKGTFDGNGKTVSNLNVTNDHAGLFGVLLGATVKNLTLENAVITGTNAGGVAGSCQSGNTIENVTMKNCTVNGEENSQTFIGGYASNGYATINGVCQVEDLVKLQDAISNAPEGSKIILSENVVDYGTITVGKLKNVTIEGNDESVMIFKTDENTEIENVTLQKVNFEYTGATDDCGVVIDANAEINNLVLENCNFVGTGDKKGRGLSGYNNSASIVIKNCNFENLGYPIYAWGGYESLTIENCTFENIKSWAIMPQSGFDGDLTVTGCNFKDCLGGGLIKAGTLTEGHTFTFKNNTITGCTIAGDHNWFQFNVSAGTTVISENTMDGSAWTPSAEDGLKGVNKVETTLVGGM